MQDAILNTTAILVFAASSYEEGKRKTIPQSQLLFKKLNQHTLTTVKKTKLPYYHFNETQQKGNNFGERFSNALKAIFDLGYEHVISLGNDTPHLTASHIHTALQCLENKKFVLGPSSDGGFYLMGIHKSLFNLEKFKQFTWQTNTLAKDIFHWVSRFEIEEVKLQQLSDLDHYQDIIRILRSSIYLPKHILKLLLNLCTLVQQMYKNTGAIVINYFSSTLFNKGSPYHYSF